MGAVEAAKEYVAGLAAGISMVAVGHPFDTVKVKLQAHNTRTSEKVYRNALHCTSRILLDEGIRGLYKGASSSFVGMTFECSLFFGTYSLTKQLLQGKTESSKPQLQAIIPAAAFSGAVMSSILTPTELVKCRLQVQGTETVYARYSGPVDCISKTLQSEGAAGIFRGGLSTLLRESIGNAVFFSVYEFGRYWLHRQLTSTSPSSSKSSTLLKDMGIGVLTGGFAGVAFWSAVMPIDVAKTVIQTAPHAYSSRNPFQIIRMIYRRSGMHGCYAGLGPTLARAFPANAATIVTWELTAKILGIRRS